MNPLLVLLASALALAIVGCAKARDRDLACDVKLESPEGGALSVVTWAEGFAGFPTAISWRPPSDKDEIQFAVGFGDSKPDSLRAPTGGHADFVLPAGHEPRDLRITLKFKSGATFTFLGEDVAVWTTDGKRKASAAFSRDSTKDSAIVRALDTEPAVTIEVKDGLDALASQDYHLAGVEARSQLLSRAAAMIEAEDPSVCKPTTP